MSTTGEDRRFSRAQLAEYFDRIRLPAEFRDAAAPSLALLAALQAAHVQAIPWENLSISTHTPEACAGDDDTPLAHDFTPERLLDKMVRRRRGGYCFEQSLLLELVLRSLGFDAHSVAARVVDWPALQPGSSKVPLKNQTHQVVLVYLEGETYLTDVAFMGDNPSQPLPLRHMAASAHGNELPCGQRQHRLRRGVIFSSRDAQASDRPADLGWYLQVESHTSGWKDCYYFTEALCTANDFVPGNFFMTQHPRSRFNKEPFVSILTPDGSKTLIGRRLRVFAGNALVAERTIGDAELRPTLEQEFGIEY